MLSRPEVGTRGHILMWLDSKDATAPYEWGFEVCPCAQYSAEYGISAWDTPISPLAGDHPRTWGALAERARKAENGTASNPWVS
jgi:hypothetical protein